MMEIDVLRQQWTDLVSRYSKDHALKSTLWEELKSYYQGKNRHYHNLAHIQDLLQQAADYQQFITDWDTLQFAIWYHDIIYNVRRKDNEARSAELASQRLKSFGYTEQKRTACANLILATKTHEIPAELENDDAKWLLDFDLSILGKSQPTYQEYVQKIRKEYHIYPDFLYKPGRKKMLQYFLNKEQIFKTETYVTLYEEQARSNLAHELAQL